MIRARFYTDEYDWRPVEWPVKYPYWCTGLTFTSNILVAYADDVDYILRLWPEAYDIEWEEVDEIEFSSRFPKPDWYEEKKAETEEEEDEDE